MNRTGLWIALGVGIAAGLVFGLYPELDLRLAALFYDVGAKNFGLRADRLANFARQAAMWISWAFALPAIAALALKIIFPRKPLIISARSMIFILLTIFLSAGLLSNLIFKSHWGRPRPVATVEFGGSLPFMPWWDPRGACPRNCSFFSGEAATAFWTYAPAALAPPQYRALAYAGATIFGLATGGLRMTFGGHYATDVIFAGVVVFLVIWLVHGFIFRWPIPPHEDDRIDRSMTAALLAARRELTPRWQPPRAFWWLLLGFATLTVARIVGLRFSVVDLFYDESQYWAWAQAPALGYFSKPPLLAWTIAAAQNVCGTAEACIRGPAPLFWFGTAITTYFLALTLYGARSAWWASLCLMLAPATIFSTRIISTDVPLLFFWALALLAFVRLRERPGWKSSWTWSVVLGVALGLGMLAKYAMAYFLFGFIVAAIIDPPTRALLRRPALWLALAIGAAILAPNLIWVASNDFVTFRHTEDNITGGGLGFHPLGALEFLASQFGIFGPIVMASFVLLLIRPRVMTRFAGLQPADRVMIAFALPPLAIVMLVGLLAKANANWAAPSMVPITVVAVALLIRRGALHWIYATLALGMIVQAALWIGDARAYRVSVPWLSKPDAYQRTLGWKSLGTQVSALAQAQGVRGIAAEQRDVVASLIYYARDTELPVWSSSQARAPAHQFDLDRPLTSSAPEPVLFVSSCRFPGRYAPRYAHVQPLGPLVTPTGAHSERHFFAFKLAGATGVTAPLGPCAP